MKSKTEQKVIQIIAAVLIVATVAVAGVFLFKQNQVVIKDFVKPEFDATASVSDLSTLSSVYSFDVIQATDTIGIGLCTDIALQDGDKYCVNAFSLDTNCDNILIKLYDDQGRLLASSGLIRPGECVEFLNAERTLKKDSIVSVKVLTYEPDTYLSDGTFTIEVNLHVDK